MDIPPQYGPGFSIDDADPFAKAIDGRDGSWELPLRRVDSLGIDRLPRLLDHGDDAACHEAAYKLLSNFENVVRFAARGTGAAGRPSFQAPLADPNATPDPAALDPVADALVQVAMALVDGAKGGETHEQGATAALAGRYSLIGPCLSYLRDRVGVPRDMSAPAAMALRAHLNWAIQASKA